MSQPDKTSTSHPALSRNVWVVTATSFLTDVSSEMVFNLLPLFLANVIGTGTAVIGLIDGIAEATASFLKVFSGWLSDRLGRRKWLTVAGYSLSAVSKPVLYVTTSWAGVLAVRFADRIGKGIRTAPRDALLADSVPADHRGFAFGVHRAGDTLGAAVGLIIALVIVLATSSSSTVVLTRETFQIAVLISTIPAFIAVMVLAFGAREVPITSTRERPHLSLAGLDSRFRAFLPIILLFTLGNSSDSFLILRAQERGLPLAGILLMLIAFNFIYAAAAGPLGVLSDRLGRRRVIIGGWIVYALIYLGFGLASETWHVVVLYVLYGIYYAATEGVAKALVGDLISQEQRGTAYGVFNAAIGIMALPASILAGLLWQFVGPSAPFIVGALLAFAAVILFSRWNGVKASAEVAQP
jgi:MFS family permease